MENPLKVNLENIIPLTEARDHFSQIVNEVQKDKLYVLTKGGKPAVAIIDVKYLEMITGGEIQKEHIVNEIKKDPGKVGLPEMLEHKTVPTPAPNLPTTPTTPPKPAGFAAPQPKPPESTPTPQSEKPMDLKPVGPEPISSSDPSWKVPETAKSPNQVNVSFTPAIEDEKPSKHKINELAAPDDKSSPAQYAGDSEPDDMALD